MKSFNTIVFDPNCKKFVNFDVIPHFINEWNEMKSSRKRYWGNAWHSRMPKTREEISAFLKAEAQYHFWARCEYEIVLQSWPCGNKEAKIDVYWQLLNNWENFVDVFIENIKRRK